MDPNNKFDKTNDDSTNFGGGAPAPMQGFQGGWNTSLNPFFPGGWTAALSQGYMPFPIPPFAAAPDQNETIARTDETAEPTIIKETQDAGEGFLPIRKGKGKVAASRNKSSNFSPKEDVFLVKSWLEISTDSVINTGQKREGFWARITTRYNKKRGPYPTRSFRSLQSRWDIIKAESFKFSGYMENVIRDNPSGMSDADKVKYYV